MNHGRTGPARSAAGRGADFADLFEVKDDARPRRASCTGSASTRVTLGYTRGATSGARRTSTRATGRFTEDVADVPGLSSRRTELWSATGYVAVGTGPALRSQPVTARHGGRSASSRAGGLAAPRRPKWTLTGTTLRRTYRRSLVDLAALRFYPEIVPDASLPAAGLPWFMALFGRDSLITSYQALPFVPELARTTLRALAAHQATDVGRLPRRRAGQDPARAAPRRAGRTSANGRTRPTTARPTPPRCS